MTCYATEPNRSALRYYTPRFAAEKAAKLPFKLADMTTCLIRTERGKVIKMDLDIYYDAAAWSAIYECSRRSLDENNGTVEIPDYTRGRWKSTDWRAGRLPA